MRRDRRWKAVALLATGMAIGLVMVASPAGAHISSWAHNWNKHIKPRADKRYIQPTVLRPGQTLRGAFAFANDAPGSGDIGTDAISFPVRLPSFPIVRIISVGGTPPAECPGTVNLPNAKPGYLCIYLAFASANLGAISTIRPEDVFLTQPAAGKTGAWIYANSTASGRQQVTGTWAVTARATTPSPRPVLGRRTSGSPTASG